MDASDRHTVDANDVLLDAHLLRRHRADALEKRDVLGQVAALRSQCGGVCRKPGEHDAVDVQRVRRADAVPAAWHAVTWVVDEACNGRMVRRPGERSNAKDSEQYDGPAMDAGVYRNTSPAR